MNVTGKGGFQDHPGNRNRKGRPTKDATITKRVMKLLDEKTGKLLGSKTARGQIIAETIVAACEKGDLGFIKILLAYVEGLPKQVLEHTGEEGGPVKVQVVFPRGFKGV